MAAPGQAVGQGARIIAQAPRPPRRAGPVSPVRAALPTICGFPQACAPALGQSRPMSHDHPIPHAESLDDNKLVTERREKLAGLRAQAQATGSAVFPNDFKPRHHAADLQAQYGALENEALEPQGINVAVAGRMMLKRIMGKASFATLQDGSFGSKGSEQHGRIQLFISRDALGEAAYDAFKHSDLGDILGAEGVLFKTRTGELSVKVSTLRLLTKSLRPLPDKFHGMADQEQKYRQRYVDLIADEAARVRFVARSKAVSSIRSFMVDNAFLEVETPMLHPIPGGANAKPFITHHNALDQQMFLRIAPELYLKRLLVGGFERVFEINRNFRNEGISVRHNPEFTMMEFYAAYWNHHDLMDFTESLLRHAAIAATGLPA
jgi:lysyl-tRNA synthetase class 2